MDQLSTKEIAPLIRSSGYFNQKALRLKVFVRHLHQKYQGKMTRMRRLPLAHLREELLNLPGIGPETADSILLYAFGKPTFVVDAYTRRVLARHSLISWKATYEEIQSLFIEQLPKDSALFNEFHALFVALGKDLCRKSYPKCHRCPLRRIGKLQLEVPAEYHP